jgi:glycosyltransferase involved in cell wall biosynthesis
VIAYRRGAVPEVVEDGVTGYIVDGIEEAVRAVAKLPELDRARCRAEFERRFTASRMADDYLRAYAAVMSRNGGCEPGREVGRDRGRGVGHPVRG